MLDRTNYRTIGILASIIPVILGLFFVYFICEDQTDTIYPIEWNLCNVVLVIVNIAIFTLVWGTACMFFEFIIKVIILLIIKCFAVMTGRYVEKDFVINIITESMVPIVIPSYLFACIMLIYFMFFR